MRVSGTWQGTAGLETVMGSACQAFPGSVAREPRWWLNALTVVGQSWVQSCFVSHWGCDLGQSLGGSVPSPVEEGGVEPIV